jgi:SAM-dependent methyltransferase
MDRTTLAAYDQGAAAFAADWHAQPPPADLHAIVRRHFRPGTAADIGCGSGREVAFLGANGFAAVGYDASEPLLAEARRRYPQFAFKVATLPALDEIGVATFDNVLCETVIMHLPLEQIAPAVRRLISIVAQDGTLYLSWRATRDADQRDAQGRLYSMFHAAVVRDALAGATLLLDEEVVSVSSGKVIHRIVARR